MPGETSDVIISIIYAAKQEKVNFPLNLYMFLLFVGSIFEFTFFYFFHWKVYFSVLLFFSKFSHSLAPVQT